MWTINTLVALDDEDNFITLAGGKLTIHVVKDHKFKISRVIDVEETPPCLSIAVDDLLRQVTHNDRPRRDKSPHHTGT